jgi:hypothetical protein
MTFYVPPVFLFGNNANRVPHDEEEKSEYKTAAETEIKVENWRVKRIAEVEEENKNLKLIQETNEKQIQNDIKERDELREENKKLSVEILGRGYSWLDTGTFDSLNEASNFVRAIEKRQGLLVGSPEETAYRNKWINKIDLYNLALPMQNNDYGKKLLKIVNKN